MKATTDRLLLTIFAYGCIIALMINVIGANNQFEALLDGQLPDLSDALLTENMLRAEIINTGEYIARLVSKLGPSPLARADQVDGYYGSAERSIVIDIASGDDCLPASVYLNGSSRFKYEVDDRGQLVTARTLLPRPRHAVIGIGATVMVGEQPVSARLSTQYNSSDTIPALDKIRGNVKNQLVIDATRLLFIKSVAASMNSASIRR